MWPEHKFMAHNTGFSSWQVMLVRDGQPCVAVGGLKPLPFTVTNCGACVVFRAVGVETSRHHVYPTHKRALNKLQAIRGIHVTPIDFVGPLQPHVLRRVAYLARLQRDHA